MMALSDLAVVHPPVPGYLCRREGAPCLAAQAVLPGERQLYSDKKFTHLCMNITEKGQTIVPD